MVRNFLDLFKVDPCATCHRCKCCGSKFFASYLKKNSSLSCNCKTYIIVPYNWQLVRTWNAYRSSNKITCPYVLFSERWARKGCLLVPTQEEWYLTSTVSPSSYIRVILLLRLVFCFSLCSRLKYNSNH